MNVRNDVGPAYAPYGPNDKTGVKRGRSPVPQADYYKHSGQAQGVYLPPKADSGRQETRRAVLWYNPAKYGTSPHQGWPMTNNNVVTNRYPLSQSVPAPHNILHLNTEHQQPPPQLVKTPSAPPTQKTGSISIEKIGDTMRAKIPSQQQDFTIHRRIVNPPGPGQQPQPQPDGQIHNPYQPHILRYD